MSWLYNLTQLVLMSLKNIIKRITILENNSTIQFLDTIFVSFIIIS